MDEKKSLLSEEAEKLNIDHWNEVAPVHFAAKSYNIDSLRKGISQIDTIQQSEFYPIKDKEILHLQCHIGTDSLSLALDGAKVTGVDFSKESLLIAEKLKDELSLPVEFIHSNIFDLKKKLDKKYDIVYTSKGVLCWINDIKRWAEIISYYLKPGGLFYMMESHPINTIFDDTIENELVIKHSYFHNEEPISWENEYPDYADQSYIAKKKTYEWQWTVSDILNGLIGSGLVIESFYEYDSLFYCGLPGMEKDPEGWWHVKKYKGKIPFTFTIKARKV